MIIFPMTRTSDIPQWGLEPSQGGLKRLVKPLALASLLPSARKGRSFHVNIITDSSHSNISTVPFLYALHYC